jgi:hypothetical protein
VSNSERDGVVAIVSSSTSASPVPAAPPRPAGRRLAALLASAAALVGAFVGAAPANAAPLDTSCSYAESGGQYPSSICWFDWSDYDSATARGTDGQDVTISLGDYTVTFNAKESTPPAWTQRDMVASAPVSALGSPGYYQGIAGKPLLYSNSGQPFGATTVAISDFSIELGGAPVTGYSLVSASPETLDAYVGSLGETTYWTSDQPLTMIDHMESFSGGSGCPLPPAGNGTTSVTCRGASVGNTSAHGVIVSAPSATEITSTMYMSSRGEREGLAFGLMTARVSLEKQVASRVDPAESFDLSIASAEGPVLGSASTATGDSATTGSAVVIPSGPVTLSETATAGSPGSLDYYDKSWACTNAVDSSPTVLPSGTEPSQSLTLAPGDDVSCVVTNTALPASISLEKLADITSAEVGDVVTYSFDATNTGSIPLDSLVIHEGAFSGTGELGAIECPTTILAPGASTSCHATYTVTQADVDAGTVTNSATATAEPVNTSTVVSSDDSSAEVGTPGAGALTVTKTADAASVTAGDDVTYTLTAVNSGSLTLHGVTLSDDAFTGHGSLGTLDCDAAQPAVLAPGEELRCTVDYTTTAQDVGTIDNTAVGNAVDPAGTARGGEATASVKVIAEAVVPNEPTTPSTPNLASTGAPVLVPLAGALLLGGAGYLALLIRRRSRKAE